jgi:hypothetical protein
MVNIVLYLLVGLVIVWDGYRPTDEYPWFVELLYGLFMALLWPAFLLFVLIKEISKRRE